MAGQHDYTDGWLTTSWAAGSELEPEESLVLIAEVGAAFVAAAGIMTAIGGRNREYTPFDRLRIRSLIGAAALPLAVALLGLSLLSAQIQPARIWSILSFAYVALIAMNAVSFARDFSRLPEQTARVLRTKRQRNGVMWTSAACGVLLLLYNGLVLSAFWPILASCSTSLLMAVWLILNLVLDDH